MIDAALAERADELMDAVCDGRIPTRAELKLKVRALLAVCANEALERGRNQGIAHCLQIVRGSDSTDASVRWILKKLADTMSEGLKAEE